MMLYLDRLSTRGWAGAAGFILAFLFTAFSVVPAAAEIVIEARVGFHGVFQLGRPFPLEVELANSGGPAEGTLDVQVWKGGATKGGSPYPVKYRREVFLAAQSRKTVQLTVDPDFISRPLTIQFTSPAAKASQEIDLRRNFSPAPVLLLVNDNGSMPAIALGPTPQSRLVSLSLNELAADARALLGVSHVIFYDQSLRELSRSQVLALDTWLSAGGRLVILGSLNYALYQEPVISRFLPVRVSGARRIAFTPAAGEGETAPAIADVWAQISAPFNGEVRAESQGVPVLVEAARGRGRVIYLALDVGRPPLSHWPGLPKLLQSLLAVGSADEPGARAEWNDTIFTQLITSPTFISTYVPYGSLFVVIVVYLLAIGALSWLWQRRRLATTQTLAALALLVTAGSVAGYVYFSRGGHIPDGVLLSSTVLESGVDGVVDAQSNLALFSTQPRRYNLQMERGWMEFTPLSNRPREARDAPVLSQEGGGVSRFQLPLREWDYRLFRLRFVDRFPLRAEFNVQGDKLTMKIDNQSGKDLFDCALLLPGQRHLLGEIRRGARLDREFSLTPPDNGRAGASGRMESLNFREVSFGNKTRDILFQSSFFPRDGDARWSGGAAVFFAWIKDPAPRVRVDDPRIQVQDYALFRATIPLNRGEDE
ncbi:MAG TPA: hypothetical protein VFQ89_04900 [Candidatus Binatia bacterium]|nr:hypothetical protein [Candidatus Binatia bacterium]